MKYLIRIYICVNQGQLVEAAKKREGQSLLVGKEKETTASGIAVPVFYPSHYPKTIRALISEQPGFSEASIEFGGFGLEMPSIREGDAGKTFSEPLLVIGYSKI